MGLYNLLFDYQKNIVDKFKDRDSYGLFLDMGLGKTILSLAFAEVNNCTKVIIITINAKAEETEEVKGSFPYWLKQSEIPYKIHTKKDNEEFLIENNDVLLINYESLFSREKNKKEKIVLKDKVKDFIKSCFNHNVAIIVDESHKMKSLKSLQTLSLFKIQKLLQLNSKKVYSYLLTGTPFTQGYIDLYAQLKFLGYNSTKKDFVDNYCILGNLPGLAGWQQPIAGYKKVNKLFDLVHQYGITIESKEVINLPDNFMVYHEIKNSVVFDLFTKEKIKGEEILNEILKRKDESLKLKYYQQNEDIKIENPYFRNIDYPNDNWIAETSGQFWLRARQLSIGFQGNAEQYKWFNKERLKSIKEFLTNNVDNYIIFYNFTPEFIELFKICDELNYNIDVFNGEIKTEFFYNKYSNMSDNEKLVNKNNIILANFASGSTGKNWQEYNKVIIASTPLYKDYAQALKRVHRPGQKNKVFYHYFYSKNWLDFNMTKALKENKQYNEDMYNADLKRINSLFKQN